MMKDDKLIELFRFYETDLLRNDVDRVERLPDDLYNVRFPGGTPRTRTLRHVAWMATEAIRFVEEAQKLDKEGAADIAETGYLSGSVSDSQGVAKLKAARSKKEKAHRWLGFIQGVLWMSGVFTLDELKEHSKKCSDDYSEADAKDDKAAMDDDARKS